MISLSFLSSITYFILFFFYLHFHVDWWVEWWVAKSGGCQGGSNLAPVSWQKSTMISTEPSGYFEASGHTDEANNYLLRTAF